MEKRLQGSDLTPTTPSPSAESPSEGMEKTRALARRYLPDAVRLLAGVAFARDSEAALHTRMIAAKAIVDIAGVIPQATPVAPSYEGSSNDGPAWRHE